MTPERWQQIGRLFEAALEREGIARAAFLEQACASDNELRREVESLLASHEQAGSFIEAPSSTATTLTEPESMAGRTLGHSSDNFLGRVFSHYRLDELLGAGGMGVLYRATDLKLGRSVAVKVLSRRLAVDETAKARFLREARAASALDHPNIGAIYHIEEQDDELFIVMAFYEGETLRQRLQRGPLPVPEALEVLRQVALGLEAAHRAGIVHRDIKPANVLRTGTGTVKILDFGLAKLASDSQAQTMTKTGEAMGTVLYVSPEQLRGEAVDARSDLWSSGALAYELFAGISPFQADSSAATAMRILGEEPPNLASVPGVPSWLAELVSELLRKAPSERPQSASEVLRRLDRPTSTGRPRSRPRGTVPALGIGAHPTQAIREEPQTSRRRRRRWTALGLAAFAVCITAAALLYLRFPRRPTDAIDSIAVLPFANASADPNTEYLSDGITESIINSLSQLRNLRVMARTTAFHYKGKDIDPQKIGRELNVRAAVTGRVQQRGDNLNIQAELVDVEKGSQLWGGQYSRKLGDVMTIQEDISKDISEKLRLRLTAEDQKQLSKRYTENSEAYQAYLRGRYEWNKRTWESLKKSVQYFNQAIEKDPGYALAYAGLADVYNVAPPLLRRHLVYFLGGPLLSPEEVFPRAKAAAMKAVELDDTLAEAHSALATVKAHYEWDWAGAEREFRKAIELNPGYPSAHYFYGLSCLGPMGRLEEAIAELRKAVALDPFSPHLLLSLGRTLYFARKYDEAIAQYRKVLELDPNLGEPSHLGLSQAYEQKGMYEEAIDELERLPPEVSKAAAMVRQAYAESGARGYWQKCLEFLLEFLKISDAPQLYFYIARYAAPGDKDQAFEWLEKAYENRERLLPFLKVEPAFDNLRSDPRYADLLRRMSLSP